MSHFACSSLVVLLVMFISDIVSCQDAPGHDRPRPDETKPSGPGGKPPSQDGDRRPPHDGDRHDPNNPKDDDQYAVDDDYYDEYHYEDDRPNKNDGSGTDSRLLIIVLPVVLVVVLAVVITTSVCMCSKGKAHQAIRPVTDSRQSRHVSQTPSPQAVIPQPIRGRYEGLESSHSTPDQKRPSNEYAELKPFAPMARSSAYTQPRPPQYSSTTDSSHQAPSEIHGVYEEIPADAVNNPAEGSYDNGTYQQHGTSEGYIEALP